MLAEGKLIILSEKGELVITEPLPSMPLFFWNDSGDRRYRASYFKTFPGVWRQVATLATLLFIGDILFIYGVLGLLLAPLLFAEPRRLRRVTWASYTIGSLLLVAMVALLWLGEQQGADVSTSVTTAYGALVQQGEVSAVQLQGQQISGVLRGVMSLDPQQPPAERFETRQRLTELAAQGCAVLLISEDLDEVFALRGK